MVVKSGVRNTSIIIVLLLIISTTIAAQSLGVFQVDSKINLVQSCDLSTYSNITKILYPNSTAIINTETIMTSTGSNTYAYTFTQTDQLGKYLVYGHCNEGGTDTVWVYDFIVTYTGQQVNTTNGYLVLALLAMATIFLVLSFSFNKEHWMLKTFFNFSAVGMGILAINSANIIASESTTLGKMGTTGLMIGIIVLSIFFLYMFVYAFIEVIKTLKEKRGLRWKY